MKCCLINQQMDKLRMSDPNEVNGIRWPSALPYDTVPQHVDFQRDDATRGMRQSITGTGIYVRALRDNIPGSYDIATLDRDSLFRWLRSRGGANPWAENIVAVLLGQAPPLPAPSRAPPELARGPPLRPG